MRCLITSLLIVHISFLCLSQTPKKAEVATLQDCSLYYEIYGEGDPLFLLHGLWGSSKHWNAYIEEYADEFEVYVIDLTGHGKSSNFQDPMSIPEAAGNLYQLIQSFGIEKINIIGFSYGADVAYHLEADFPGTIRSMITIGGIGTWNALDYPDWIEHYSYDNLDNLKWIWNHQTDEEHIKWLLDNFSKYSPFLSDDAYADIQTRTLIVVGDNDDSIPLIEIQRVRKLMPTTNLWIVPNKGHGAHRGTNKELFVEISKDFLSRE